MSRCVAVSLFVCSCESVCRCESICVPSEREVCLCVDVSLFVCRCEPLCRCECLYVDVSKMNNGHKDPWGLVSVSAVLAGDRDFQHVHQV